MAVLAAQAGVRAGRPAGPGVRAGLVAAIAAVPAARGRAGAAQLTAAGAVPLARAGRAVPGGPLAPAAQPGAAPPAARGAARPRGAARAAHPVRGPRVQAERGTAGAAPTGAPRPVLPVERVPLGERVPPVEPVRHAERVPLEAPTDLGVPAVRAVTGPPAEQVPHGEQVPLEAPTAPGEAVLHAAPRLLAAPGPHEEQVLPADQVLPRVPGPLAGQVLRGPAGQARPETTSLRPAGTRHAGRLPVVPPAPPATATGPAATVPPATAHGPIAPGELAHAGTALNAVPAARVSAGPARRVPLAGVPPTAQDGTATPNAVSGRLAAPRSAPVGPRRGVQRPAGPRPAGPRRGARHQDDPLTGSQHRDDPLTGGPPAARPAAATALTASPGALLRPGTRVPGPGRPRAAACRTSRPASPRNSSILRPRPSCGLCPPIWPRPWAAACSPPAWLTIPRPVTSTRWKPGG